MRDSHPPWLWFDFCAPSPPPKDPALGEPQRGPSDVRVPPVPHQGRRHQVSGGPWRPPTPSEVPRAPHNLPCAPLPAGWARWMWTSSCRGRSSRSSTASSAAAPTPRGKVRDLGRGAPNFGVPPPPRPAPFLAHLNSCFSPAPPNAATGAGHHGPPRYRSPRAGGRGRVMGLGLGGVWRGGGWDLGVFPPRFSRGVTRPPLVVPS